MAISPDENYSQCSIEELSVHKNWKARLHGYESASKVFQDISDEYDERWNRYVSIIKHFVADNNAPALEIGLEAVVLFAEKSHQAGNVGCAIIPNIIQKCIASPRARTAELAMKICLRYVELEKFGVVLDEIMKGLCSKNPKLLVACLRLMREIIEAFGANVFSSLDILQKLISLLEDRDQNVRNEAKYLMVALHKCLGKPFSQDGNILKSPQASELLSEISKISHRSSTPVCSTKQKTFRRTSSVDAKNVPPSEYQSCHNSDDKVPEVSIKIPADIYSKINSPKWTDRRDTLESFEKILLGAPKIADGDFLDVIKLLIHTVLNDANIIVVCLAIKCISLLSAGLRTKFTPYTAFTSKALLEKFKEKKQSVVIALREALDNVLKYTSLEQISEALIENLRSKNPNVKSETALFLSRCFSHVKLTVINKKIVERLIKALMASLTDQDPNVRDNTAKALGVALQENGETYILPFLAGVDSSKIAKIKGNDNLKPVESIEINQIAKDKAISIKSICKKSKKLGRSECRNSGVISDGQNKSERKTDDRSFILTDEIKGALLAKAWTTRLEAIAQLQETFETVNISGYELTDLVKILSDRIMDNNSRIALSTLSLLGFLLKKIGTPFKEHIPVIFPSLLKSLGNQKIRSGAIECLDTLGKTCGFKKIFEGDSLTNVLKSGPPMLRLRVWDWVLSKILTDTPKELSKDDISLCLPSLFVSLEDRNSDIRKLATDIIDGFIQTIGSDIVISAGKKYFKNPKNIALKLIVNKCNKGVIFNDTTPLKTNQDIRVDVASDAQSHEIKTHLLEINNLKDQRAVDEHNRKVVKWDFSTPNVEFVELLKKLMTTAKFSDHLINLLFHSDFKFHLEAIDLLSKEIIHNTRAIICNLDLILRWTTLLLFNSNPSVLFKILDFLLSTFHILVEKNYCLLDSEVLAFVPYVILKLNDPILEVQAKAKEILSDKMTKLYPVNKLRVLIMNGTKTKSARQKCNCFEVLKIYIDKYGSHAYNKDVSQIAGWLINFLTDKDETVREKSFSLAAKLYEREGEAFLTYVRKSNGGGGAILETQFKKLLSVTSPLPTSQMLAPTTSVSSSSRIASTLNCSDVNHTDELNLTGPFKMDKKLIAQLDDIVNISVPSPHLHELDLDFLKTAIDHPQIENVQTSQICKALYTTSRTEEITLHLAEIENNDVFISLNALRQIDMMLNSDNNRAFLALICDVVQRLTEKLSGISYTVHSDNVKLYAIICSILLTVCSNEELVRRLSTYCLTGLIEQLLIIISDNNFQDHAETVYRKTVNAIILKVLEKAKKTDLLCSIFQLLTDSGRVKPISNKIRELCVKCLWKLNRSQAMWDEELDYPQIFLALQCFLNPYPRPWWKCNSDITVRTVKTILRSMVNSRGKRVLQGFDDFSNESSDLKAYIHKLLKSVTIITPNKLTSNDETKTSQISNHASELSSIFHVIASSPPEGMRRLEKFKSDNPEIDLHPIIDRECPTFFNYFRTSCSVGEDSETARVNGQAQEGANVKRFSNGKLAQQMWDRLTLLREKIETPDPMLKPVKNWDK